MSRQPPTILIIGYGNPGRRDDGLGPALAARLGTLDLPGVTVESDYQLSIEHADLISHHDIIVFADAARDVPGKAPFYLSPVSPAPEAPSLSHNLSPQAVLQIAADCFGAHPKAWLLGIRPADLVSFGEGITPQAQKTLAAALACLREAIQSGRLAG